MSCDLQCRRRQSATGKWMFLCAFVSSCFLFWWMRSILIRFVFHFQDSVENTTIAVSVFAVVCFAAGYLLPVSGSPRQRISAPMLNACADIAYKSTVILFFPALLIAIQMLRTHIGLDYGSGGPTPRPYQAVLYTHLFFGFMCVASADPENHGWHRMWIATALLVLPRLIVSIHGSRFFLAQAVFPILLIVMARGWFRLTLKRVIQTSALVLFIIFVPAITRGDQTLGAGNGLTLFMDSDILGLFQNNTDISLNSNCPPLLISLTAKTIPYGLLGVCVVDIGGLKNMPATLERILTNNEPGSFQGTVAGTGSNYLLELYVTGGLFAVYAGSALFGFSCRRFLAWMGKRSLFSGIWAECLTRALLAPRGNLGYVYERIPSLVLATFLVIAVVWSWRLAQKEYAVACAVSTAKER